jgi:hypothetical protein
MKIFYSFLLAIVIFAGSNVFSANLHSSKTTQLPGEFFVVLYVESVDQEKIQAFISELETLPNKIVSVVHNPSTHEFTIIFTELIRSDTLYQLVLKYFDDFKEVDGYYLN